MTPLLSSDNACKFFESVLDGHRLTRIDLRGVDYYIANELGDFLEYGPRGLVKLIGNEWSDRLADGKHYAIFVGDDLALVKSTLNALDSHGETERVGPGAERVEPRAPSLLLLTREGVNRVLILSGKPRAILVQDWLAEEVMPAIQDTGSYSVAGASAKEIRAERSLRLREQAEARTSAAAVLAEQEFRVRKAMMLLRGAKHLERTMPHLVTDHAALMSAYHAYALTPADLAAEIPKQQTLPGVVEPSR